jgi:hypothetical protein
MKLIFLAIGFSLHGLIFTDELGQATKVAGLCVLITLALYMGLKSSVVDDESDYK